MATVDLAERLTNEHHDIDEGIEAFVRALDGGTVEPEPLLRAFAALRRHIYLEEELLFPAIRRAGMLMPILVMIREHGEVWQLMDELDAVLAAADIDAGTARSTSQELLEALDRHNEKEEPVIYPHTSTDLTPEEAELLDDFIETGSMPQGWVCEAAR